MHGTTSPAGAAGGSTEQLRHEFSRWHAFGQSMPMASVSTKDRIFCSQVSTDRGRDSFLPNVSMTGPVNQSSLMTSSQLLFGLANNLHRTIKRKDLFVGHVCRWIQQREIRGIELVRASGTPVSARKGTFADVAQASGQQIALECRSSRGARQVATTGNRGGGRPNVSLSFVTMQNHLGRIPHSPAGTSGLGDEGRGVVSKNSEGAECTASHPDQTDNPRFSRKQYSCEKNDVIHFCIMTG